jgi:hypothetical protein
VQDHLSGQWLFSFVGIEFPMKNFDVLLLCKPGIMKKILLLFLTMLLVIAARPQKKEFTREESL